MADSRAWPGGGWLRVALLAGLAAGLIAAAFNLGVGERVVDEAIALEGAHAHGTDAAGHTHVTAIAEPFTRGEQKGGMLAGQALLGLGVGLLLAGAALMVGRTRLSPQRFWLVLVGGAVWALLVLPAVKFPPLPPGVETALEVEQRQIWYLLLIASGLVGALLASAVWTRVPAGPRRAVAAAAALVVPAVIAVAALPGDEIVTAVDSGLLARFRVVSIASQALFWLALAGFGLWLLEHRRLPFSARRRAVDA